MGSQCCLQEDNLCYLNSTRFLNMTAFLLNLFFSESGVLRSSLLQDHFYSDSVVKIIFILSLIFLCVYFYLYIYIHLFKSVDQ